MTGVYQTKTYHLTTLEGKAEVTEYIGTLTFIVRVFCLLKLLVMKYFKRRWEETRGDQYNIWGFSTWFFETDEEGWPIRQIEIYDNGSVLKYSKDNPDNEYGRLGDQALDIDEFAPFEISAEVFESTWAEK